jgi:hypothetical protein
VGTMFFNQFLCDNYINSVKESREQPWRCLNIDI